jgi:hypothetical protein
MFLTNALRRRPAGGFSWRDRVNLLKHAAHADEMVIEDFFGRIKQLKYAFVVNGVIDVCTFFTRDDDISVAQYSKLLRGVSLLDLKTLADLVDGQLAVSQGIKDRNSQGVSQSFEKVCLEFTELLSHQRPILPNRMTLLNGSDMHICTFLHILMFLLASSQQMLDLRAAIASPAGFQNNGMQRLQLAM